MPIHRRLERSLLRRPPLSWIAKSVIQQSVRRLSGWALLFPVAPLLLTTFAYSSQARAAQALPALPDLSWEKRGPAMAQDKGSEPDTPQATNVNPSPKASEGPPALPVASSPGGGASFTSLGNGIKVRPSARIHSDFRNFSTPETARSTDTFEVRRARLGFEFQIDDWIEGEVTGDFSSQTTLDTAYINVSLADAVQLRFGLFKMPFSLEELTSSNYIDFQERSLANGMTPGKERGFMLHGRPAAGFTYGIALSNGNGGADTDESGRKDMIGRVTVNPAEWMNWRDAILHAGIAATRGKRMAGDVGYNGRSEGRGFRFFDPVAFTGSEISIQRQGIEIALASGPVKVQAEHITASFDGLGALGDPYERGIAASYASLSWLVTGETYPGAYRAGAFRNIKPKTDFHPRRGGLGAIELGLRYSRFDGSDFTASNPLGTGLLGNGLTSRAKAWTWGVKWILNPNLRLIGNVVHTRYNSPVMIGSHGEIHERAVTFRGQINF